VSEQSLDRSDIDAAVEQMSCEAVAQRMEGELLLSPRPRPFRGTAG
jgi:hypothetical protein